MVFGNRRQVTISKNFSEFRQVQNIFLITRESFLVVTSSKRIPYKSSKRFLAHFKVRFRVGKILKPSLPSIFSLFIPKEKLMSWNSRYIVVWSVFCLDRLNLTYWTRILSQFFYSVGSFYSSWSTVFSFCQINYNFLKLSEEKMF